MLNELGHIAVVVCSSKSQFLARSGLNALQIVHAPIEKKRVVALFALWRFVKNFEPDCVVTHSSTDAWIVAVLRLFSPRKFRLIRTRHVRADVNDNFLTRWLYRQSDQTVTTSEDIAKYLSTKFKFLNGSIHSIPTGVNIARFLPANKKRAHEFRRQTKPSVESKILLMVSTLRSWKGHRETLRALRYLDEFCLWIVGDGPLETELKTIVSELEISEKVIFWGFQQDVAEFFQKADLFLQPSLRHEGVSQSLLQAQASGLPVVASDIGGLNEVVEHGVTGRLIEPGSESAILGAIREFRDDPNKFATMAERARLAVVRKHSEHAMLAKMISVYESGWSDSEKKVVE